MEASLAEGMGRSLSGGCELAQGAICREESAPTGAEPPKLRICCLKRYTHSPMGLGTNTVCSSTLVFPYPDTPTSPATQVHVVIIDFGGRSIQGKN